LDKRTILAVDVGGHNVKVRRSVAPERRKTSSGKDLSAEGMVQKVKELTADWAYDVVAIGVPGPVGHDRVTLDPFNLGPGWVGFDFGAAFGKPTRVLNDAAMQALGSYEGGKMLFLGLGTGLGAALVVAELVLPLEVAHLPYKKSRSFEDYVGDRGLERAGPKSWEKAVADVAKRLRAALCADYVVLGGGNAKKLAKMPPDCRLGSNDNAFIGGFRLWEGASRQV
jgi:polyphosphate glucokinase